MRADGEIHTADVVGVRGGVRIATISKQNRGRLMLYDTEGDPMTGQEVNVGRGE